MLRILVTFCLLLGSGMLLAQAGSKTTPSYVDPKATGDPVADEKAHIEAKTKWIKANPEVYRAAGGDPSVVMDKPVEKVESPVLVLPKFEVRESYFLAKIEAIPSNTSKATVSELQAETENVKKDFPLNTTKLRFSDNGKISIVSGPNKDLRGIESVTVKIAIWDFNNAECPSCSKKFELLRSVSGDQVVYVMQSEDEGSPFAYRFSFTKE